MYQNKPILLFHSPPFGSGMSTRAIGNYRYGFNTQEKDDEIAGKGNSYTAEFWQYDGRLGRRFNVDPVDQITLSNYSVLKNNPLLMIDIKGDKSNSRHLDPDGNVIAEYDDGDDNVYKHQTARTKADVDYWRNKFKNTSGNGVNIGRMTMIATSGIYSKAEFGKYFNGGNNMTNPSLSSDQSNGGGWVEPANTWNGGLGVLAGVVENLSGKVSIGTNGKLYTSGWGGSQYVSTIKVAKVGKVLGNATLVAGTLIDGYGVYSYYKNGANSPNAVHPGKATLNLGVGIWGLANPATAVGAAMYYGVDAFYPGGFNGAMKQNNSLIQQNKAILGQSWNLYRDY
jgi:hypothetical protein